MMTTRKAFLTQLAGGGVLLLLGGCGGGGSDSPEAPPPQPDPSATCGRFTFVGNHGHVLSIPIEDLDSDTDKTYGVQGSAPHNHALTLTAAQLAELKAGRAIAVTTGIGGAEPHTHGVSGTCA
jgi:hypothetical protein